MRITIQRLLYLFNGDEIAKLHIEKARTSKVISFRLIYAGFVFFYLHTHTKYAFIKTGLSFPSFIRFVKVARFYTNKDPSLRSLLSILLCPFRHYIIYLLYIYSRVIKHRDIVYIRIFFPSETIAPAGCYNFLFRIFERYFGRRFMRSRIFVPFHFANRLEDADLSPRPSSDT